VAEAPILTRVAYFYFDPAKMPFHTENGFAEPLPRLAFEDAALLDTAAQAYDIDRERGRG